MFNLAGTGNFFAQPLTIAGATTLTRKTSVANANRRNVDVIATAAPFSETTYKELAFDAIDVPGSLRPLFRWTVQPRFYIRTLFDDTGEPVPAPYIDMTVTEIQRVTPQWTAGMWTAEITMGPGPPPDTTNRISVLYVHPDTAQVQCHARVLYTRELGTTYPTRAGGVRAARPAVRPRSARDRLKLEHDDLIPKWTG